MWESLQGCCDYLTGNGSVEEPEPGQITVLMGLSSRPSPAAKQALTEYARLYLRDCGWAIRGIKVEGSVLRMKLTKRR